MLSSYVFGVLPWLAYGLFIDAQAVALTNAATAILITAATERKASKERQGFEPVGCRRIIARKRQAAFPRTTI